MRKFFFIDIELLIGGDYSGFIYCVLEFVIFWFLNVWNLGFVGCVCSFDWCVYGLFCGCYGDYLRK